MNDHCIRSEQLNLRLYNTATGKKETFLPMHQGRVGIYVCGVTVYDLCHVGHARSAIVYDVLVRYLRAKGLEVTYIRNFTDVDDKIIDRANRLGKATGDLAQEYIDAFHEDMDRLYVEEADVEPRATEHIEGMIEMIITLLEKGHAYSVGDEVFFSVESFRGYGSLSGRRLDDMEAGSRVAVDEKKRHPMDFVLWKGAKPGEPQWPSPWGPGRPGWHLECSVMSNHYLGPTFDIHGGGRDLLFPHHENERAQSIGANGGHFARYWIHNGFVTVESEKMSKSLGNFLTIRDALEKYHPQVLRLFLLSTHYRTPLDLSESAIEGVRSGLVRIYRTFDRLEKLLGPMREEILSTRGLLTGENPSPFIESFIAAMDDDMNTGGAIGLTFEKLRETNRLMDSDDAGSAAFQDRLRNARQQIYSACRVLGLLRESTSEFFDQISTADKGVDPVEIERLIQERASAKSRKDWTRADAIRDHLKTRGVVLEDGPKGTTWRFDVSNPD